MKTKIFSLFILTLHLHASFYLGAGGFDIEKQDTKTYSFKYNKRAKHTYITELLCKQSPNINSVTIWITRNWEEEWFSADEVQHEIIDKGYTPLFIFYFFGDDISKEYLSEHKKEYFQQLRHFKNYLLKLHGQKIVVLNPEYNMAGCEKLETMNDIFLQSFQILKQDPQVVVGPCVGDFGNYAKTDEQKEWKLFHPSLYRAAKEADFIAFQEMRALTRNKKDEILTTAQRAYHLSKYLYKTYHKPTLLAYLAISSYGENGEKIQAEAFKKFLYYLPKMKKESHLILFSIFHYFDYPGHKGYFNAAEEHFGVLRKDGSKKASFYYLKKF